MMTAFLFFIIALILFNDTDQPAQTCYAVHNKLSKFALCPKPRDLKFNILSYPIFDNDVSVSEKTVKNSFSSS